MQTDANVSDFTPRHATTLAEREGIFRLRYNVYVDEQQKRQYAAADHERRRLVLDADADPHAQLFLSGGAECPTATARLRVWMPGQLSTDIVRRYSLNVLPEMRDRTVADITCLIVRREERGRAALLSLLHRVIEEAFGEHRADMLVMCCLDRLLPLYLRLGLRPFGAPAIETPDGRMTVLMWVAGDMAAQQRARSPLEPLLERLTGGRTELASYAAIQNAIEDGRRDAA